jgi:hypothetical protein
MSEVILSPGVFQIESDQSLYTQAPPALGAAIVGPTVGGRPLVPTYVTTYAQYQSIFGDIFKSGSYYYEYLTSIAAKDYFQNGGQTLLVTRIVSGSAGISTYATANIQSNTLATTSSVTISSASLAPFITPTGSFVVNGITIAITGSTTPANTSTTIFVASGSTSANTITNVITAFNASSSAASYSASLQYIIAAASGSTGLFFNSTTAAPYTAASTYYLTSGSTTTLFTGATAANSFQLEALTWGDQMNNSSSISNGALANGSAYNVRWEITNVQTGSGTFTLVVRRGDDNNSQKNILETWANMSLDPQLSNYVGRVIGDVKPVYIPATGTDSAYIQYQGSYANVSKYIRVSSVTTPNVDSLDNNGNFKTGSYVLTLPTVGSGSYGGSFSGGVVDTTTAKLMNENITATNIQGFAPADYNTAFNLLTNKDEYQFNVLMAPGVGLDCSAATTMISTAEGRGDAIAILGAGVYSTAINTAVQNAAGQSSNYAACYYPWVQLYSSNLGKAVWCPPSTVIGGVLAFNDQVGAEWFAPAGLNRGGIPSVIRAERRLSQTDRDTLYTGNVNPLATFPGTGVCVWGQKTLQRKATALDRVNVRRLLIALKDFIGGISRTLVFEQNTTVTRNSFLSRVNPYLSSIVSRQGLYAYKVVMDETNNTADVVDRNQLVGQIYIQPTKTAEFIILNFNILPTGATFPA